MLNMIWNSLEVKLMNMCWSWGVMIAAWDKRPDGIPWWIFCVAMRERSVVSSSGLVLLDYSSVCSKHRQTLWGVCVYDPLELDDDKGVKGLAKIHSPKQVNHIKYFFSTVVMDKSGIKSGGRHWGNSQLQPNSVWSWPFHMQSTEKCEAFSNAYENVMHMVRITSFTRLYLLYL